MERDLEEFFKPEDLYTDHTEIYGWFNMTDERKGEAYWQAITSKANSILSQWLKEQVTVYGDETHSIYSWYEREIRSGDTHSATLVNIKKVGG